MIGRGAMGNPWLFDRSRRRPPSVMERLTVLVAHTRLFERLFRKQKSFAVMKKHYKAYVNGFPGAKELRMELMEAADSREVARIVKTRYAEMTAIRADGDE